MASTANVASSNDACAGLPLIDLNWPRDRLLRAMDQACMEWGFFQVVGHDISESVVKDLEDAMDLFFVKSPARIKQSVFRTSDNSRGYFNNELTKQRPDFKEGFDVGHEGQFEIDGENRWPSEPACFHGSVKTYLTQVERLAKRLFEIILGALGLDPSSLLPEFSDNTSWMRLNYYPACKDQPVAPASFGNREPPKENNEAFSINRHTDSGALTVLYHRRTDPSSLQVYSRRQKRFIRVRPVPKSFTINIGDVLQVWSNDRYRAPIHRVLAHPSRPRISIPFFLNPNYDTICESKMTNEAPRYTPFAFGHFRRKRIDGDIADIGKEVQVSDWKLSKL